MKRTPEYFQRIYVETTLDHGQATAVGDYRRGNKAYVRNVKAFAEIRKLPDQGRQFLLGLLDHSSPWVRAMAAGDLLFTDPDKASALLEGMSLVESFPWQLRASCETVLEEWRAGRFQPRA